MKCTMIARLLILVSHYTFMSFRWEPWAVSSNGWFPHYWECFLTPFKMIARSGRNFKQYTWLLVYITDHPTRYAPGERQLRVLSITWYIYNQWWFQTWGFPSIWSSSNAVVVWGYKQCINQRFCVTSLCHQNTCTMSDAIGMSLPQYMQNFMVAYILYLALYIQECSCL